VASIDRASREGGQGAVVLRLELDAGEPLTGSVALDGQPGSRFCGWIELMAAIGTARASGKAHSSTKDHGVSVTLARPGSA
jgi:hypothetical protein